MKSVFVAVLNMSLTGSMIIAAVIVMRFFLGKMPRKYSYALWAIPALRLLCPISVSSVVSLFNFLKPAVSENRMEYIPSPSRVYTAPTLPSDPVYPTAPTTGVYVSPKPESAMQPAARSEILSQVICYIWFAVAILIVIWAIASCFSVRKRVKNAEKMDGYYLCQNIPSPFVFGIFRPKIYISAGVSNEDLNCILMHERTHIKRRDYLVKLLTVPVLALHWFNPLVWLGIRLMTADMELSCDEAALRNMSEDFKKVYANALLNISMSQNKISLSGVLGFGESDLKTRVKGVLKMKKPKLWASLTALLVIAIAAVCLLTNANDEKSSAGLPGEIDGYINYENAEIPEFHFDETTEITAFTENTAPKVLFAKADAGDVSAYLLGEGVYRDENEPSAIRAIDLKLGISTDGKHITSEYPAPAEFIGESRAHYEIREESASDYLSAFDMELPIIEINYIGEDLKIGAFYAVKDGELLLLMGDTSEIGGETSGVCFGYTELERGAEPDALIFKSLNSHGVEFVFNFDNIRSDEYIGPHFTAKRVGAQSQAAESNPEFEDIINRYMLFEDYFIRDSLAIGSMNPNDDAIGPGDGVIINGEEYYPVTEVGFTEWRQLKDFMYGLFTDDLADYYISDGHYAEYEGRTFSLMAGGTGWYASSSYIYGSEEIDGGIRLDFYREWDGGETGEYLATQLILKITPEGLRISECSDSYIEPGDSYDWLAPVDRFAIRTFMFEPDLSGRKDFTADGAAREITFYLRYSPDGSFLGATTDTRGESAEVLAALDENRLIIYDDREVLNQQIYLIDLSNGSTSALLPETAYGFDYNDYYNLSGDDRIVWVEKPKISSDGRKIIYRSNKYSENGRALLRGGIWIYDIESETEFRLPETSDRSSGDYFILDADDFDGDGSYEAFGVLYDEDGGVSLRFITENGEEEIDKDGYDIYGARILNLGSEKVWTVELSFGTVSFTHIYGVRGGEWYEHEFSGAVTDLTQIGGNLFTGIDASGYDAFYDEKGRDAGGHTYKTYYFYYDDEGFREYGGTEIGLESLKEFPGASEVIGSFGDYEITGIFYRGDAGVIDINLQKTDADGWKENKTAAAALENGRLRLIRYEDGVKSAAMFPAIAVYPQVVFGFQPAFSDYNSYSSFALASHLERDGDGFSYGWNVTEEAGVVKISFDLPKKWEYSSLNASLNGRSVFGVKCIFPENEFDQELFRTFPDTTVYPKAFNANEGESADITVYEESLAEGEPYIFKRRYRVDDFDIGYESCEYFVNSNGYCVYLLFTGRDGFDPSSPEGDRICREIMKSISVELYSAPELTDERIKSLIERDFEAMKIIYTDYLSIDETDSVNIDGESYYRVTDERFDSFSEIEKLAEGLYISHFASDILSGIYGKTAVTEVGGMTYRSAGRELDFPESFEVKSTVGGGYTVQAEIDGGAGYVFQLTSSGWLIENRFDDPWYPVLSGE